MIIPWKTLTASPQWASDISSSATWASVQARLRSVILATWVSIPALSVDRSCVNCMTTTVAPATTRNSCRIWPHQTQIRTSKVKISHFQVEWTSMVYNSLSCWRLVISHRSKTATYTSRNSNLWCLLQTTYLRSTPNQTTTSYSYLSPCRRRYTEERRGQCPYLPWMPAKQLLQNSPSSRAMMYSSTTKATHRKLSCNSRWILCLYRTNSKKCPPKTQWLIVFLAYLTVVNNSHSIEVSRWMKNRETAATLILYRRTALFRLHFSTSNHSLQM